MIEQEKRRDGKLDYSVFQSEMETKFEEKRKEKRDSWQDHSIFMNGL